MRFETKIRVRVSDCDRLDHVNNAEYVNYLFQATAEAVGYADFQGMRMSNLIVDYRKPARFGELLTVGTWLSGEYGHFQVLAENGDVVARAQMGWQAGSAPSGRDTSPFARAERGASHSEAAKGMSRAGEARPKGIARADASVGALAPGSLTADGEPPFRLKPAWRAAESEGRPFQWGRDVQLRDLAGRLAQDMPLHPTSVVRWVEEAIFVSSAKRGWPLTRMAAANSLVFMTQHDLSLTGNVALGEAITIQSRIHELRKVRGTWRIDFMDAETQRPIATDYATGAFVNREGQLAPPPAGLFEACLLGEPERSTA